MDEVARLGAEIEESRRVQAALERYIAALDAARGSRGALSSA